MVSRSPLPLLAGLLSGDNRQPSLASDHEAGRQGAHVFWCEVRKVEAVAQATHVHIEHGKLYQPSHTSVALVALT